MSQGMAVAEDWEDIQQDIESYWNSGYMVTNLEYGYGKWFALFETNTGYSTQGYNSIDDIEDFAPIVTKRWKNGYRLTGFAEGRD